MFIYDQEKSLFLFSGEAGEVAVSHISHHVDMYIKKEEKDTGSG